MKATTFTAKMWRWLSIIALVIVLTYGYSLLPADVGVHFDENGKADQFMTKSSIFYIILGIVLLNNVAIMAVGQMIAERKLTSLPIPNQSLWAEFQDDLKDIFQNWYHCLVAAVNTLVAFTFGILATVNNEFKFNIHSFGWVFYLAVGLLVLVVVYLPIRLLVKPKN